MKARYIVLTAVALVLQLLTSPAVADKLRLNDGRSIEGIVQRIDKGKVTIVVAGTTQDFDVLEIAGIDFDTEHLTAGTPRLPLEHFLSNMEAQEMVGHIQQVEESAARVRELIAKTKQEWAERRSIKFDQTTEWINAKERLYGPLSRYQEALDDLYFHALGKVDEYNQLMNEADDVYVGVKGWFNVGSSLVPSGMEKLPLKKYVPGNWYDSIFFEGYDRGYSDAAEKYRKELTSSNE